MDKEWAGEKADVPIDTALLHHEKEQIDLDTAQSLVTEEKNCRVILRAIYSS